MNPTPSAERLLDDPERASRGGWAFDASQGFEDPVFQAKDLREVYDRSAGDSDMSSDGIIVHGGAADRKVYYLYIYI